QARAVLPQSPPHYGLRLPRGALLVVAGPEGPGAPAPPAAGRLCVIPFRLADRVYPAACIPPLRPGGGPHPKRRRRPHRLGRHLGMAGHRFRPLAPAPRPAAGGKNRPLTARTPPALL